MKKIIISLILTVMLAMLNGCVDIVTDWGNKYGCIWFNSLSCLL